MFKTIKLKAKKIIGINERTEYDMTPNRNRCKNLFTSKWRPDSRKSNLSRTMSITNPFYDNPLPIEPLSPPPNSTSANGVISANPANHRAPDSVICDNFSSNPENQKEEQEYPTRLIQLEKLPNSPRNDSPTYAYLNESLEDDEDLWRNRRSQCEFRNSQNRTNETTVAPTIAATNGPNESNQNRFTIGMWERFDD